MSTPTIDTNTLMNLLASPEVQALIAAQSQAAIQAEREKLEKEKAERAEADRIKLLRGGRVDAVHPLGFACLVSDDVLTELNVYTDFVVEVPTFAYCETSEYETKSGNVTKYGPRLIVAFPSMEWCSLSIGKSGDVNAPILTACGGTAETKMDSKRSALWQTSTAIGLLLNSIKSLPIPKDARFFIDGAELIEGEADGKTVGERFLRFLDCVASDLEAWFDGIPERSEKSSGKRGSAWRSGKGRRR